MDTPDVAPFCALASRACQEPLAGSATAETSIWIALEYDGPWGRKFVKTSGLASAVRERLGRWMDEIPGCRAQLIKRDHGPPAGSQLFIALAHEQDAALYRFELERHAALLEFDLAPVVARDPALAAHRVDAPIVLVCTNGQRDRCCAKFGLPVYQRLAAFAPERSWQTTHIGGHRYAATAVVLPYGLVYGHLGPEDAEPLVRAHDRGHLYRLETLRGRSCHAKPVQIAESLLREHLQEYALDSLRVVQTAPAREPGGPIHVRFCDPTGRVHEVAFTSEPSAETRIKGCGEAPQPFRRHRLQLVS